MLNRTSSRFLISLTSLVALVHCSSDPEQPAGDNGAANGATVTTAGNDTSNTSSATTQGSNTNGTSNTTTTGGATTNVTSAGTTNTTTSAGTTNTTVTNGTTTTTTTTGGGGAGATTTTGAEATATTGGPDVDQNGKMNAAKGESTDVPQDYLRLGEIRILNNNWGSEDLGCTAPTSTMSVFVNEGGAFGWTFNRGDCAQPMDTSHPDFPQLEFGIHPFGIDSPLQTSPPFSSTTLLPIQIKDITSASVTLEQFNISLSQQSSWNTAMEFWLSERHPIDDPNPGVYAEIMGWWGWNAGRWPCDLNNDGMVDYGDNVQAGSMGYTLCHQSDNWADGWRYYQFRAGDGSDGNIRNDFNGTVNVKAFLDYLVNNRGYSSELWLTRIEVGSEIDDDTAGTVSMNSITFEVNGQNRSQIIAP